MLAVPRVQTVAGLVCSAIRCRAGGAWQVLQTYLAGRNSVAFERERRVTLLALPSLLPPGAQLRDHRSDGSILEVQILPTPLDVVDQGASEHSTRQRALSQPELPCDATASASPLSPVEE